MLQARPGAMRAALVALALLLLGGPSAAAAASVDKLALLTVDLGPVSSNLSAAEVGSGRLEADLLSDGNTFLWNLNLTGVKEVTKAHFHYGGPGEKGPAVVVLLPIGTDKSTDMLPRPLSGDVPLAGAFTPAQFLDLLAGRTADEFLQLVAQNKIYTTIHTLPYPNGALRAQVVDRHGSTLNGAPALAPAPAQVQAPGPDVAAPAAPEGSPLAPAPVPAPQGPASANPAPAPVPAADQLAPATAPIPAPVPDPAAGTPAPAPSAAPTPALAPMSGEPPLRAPAPAPFAALAQAPAPSQLAPALAPAPLSLAIPLPAPAPALEPAAAPMIGPAPAPAPTQATVSASSAAGVQSLEAVLAAPAGSAGGATGTFTMTRASGADAFGWLLTVKDITGLTQVHIHSGDPSAGGAALLVGLLPPGTGDTHTPYDPPRSGNLSFEGTFTPADFYADLKGQPADAFMRMAAAGQLYINVHSVTAPTSALNGRLLPPGGVVPAPATSLEAVLVPPPGAASGSAAAAKLSMRLQDDGSAFGWVLNMQGMEDLTQVHIHSGNPSAGGAALLVGLLPPGTGDTHTPYDPPRSGNLSFEGTFTPADFYADLKGQPADAFMRMAAAGQLYINVHSLTAPTSALNGQLVPKLSDAPVPPPPPPPASPSSSSVPLGAIIGGVAGAVALAAVAAGFFIWSRKRKQRGGDVQQLAEVGESTSHKLSASTGGSQPKGASPPGQRFSGWQLQSQGAASDTFLTASKLAPTNRSSPSSHPSTRGRQSLGSDPLLALIASNLSSLPAAGTAGRADMASGQLESGASGVSRASRATSASQRPDVQHLILKWDDLVIEKRIGAGSFGQVFAGKYFSTPVAVKVLVDRDTFEAGGLTLPPALMHSLEEETRVLSRIRHPNVLALMGLCEKPACIITEYCQHGSLYDVLRGGASDPNCAAHLTWKLRLGMAIDAATGILYLHSRSPPIIHRDLKSPNLLVDKHFTVKVGDFGLSKILEEHTMGIASVASSLGGALNPIWLSPEMLRGDKATSKSDVFAFALILWELLTWQLPWAGMAPFKIMQAVLSGQRPPIPPAEALPGAEGPFPGLEAYCQLINECWADDPADRPAFDAVVARLEELLPLAS